MVTSEEEIEDSHDRRHKISCKWPNVLLAWTLADTEQFALGLGEISKAVRLLLLNSSVILQVTIQLGLFRKPLVLGALPTFCPRAVLTFQGHCRNMGTDLGPDIHPDSAIQ